MGSRGKRKLSREAKRDARKLASPDHFDGGPSDPREKEAALLRLRDASDEKLAVFESQLRNDALDAGASEREMRDAQRTHPGHGA